MKVCITTHTHPGFGEIPAGSLWADDSPYVTEDAMFADVPAVEPKPAKEAAVRKFGQKEASDGDSGLD